LYDNDTYTAVRDRLLNYNPKLMAHSLTYLMNRLTDAALELCGMEEYLGASFTLGYMVGRYNDQLLANLIRAHLQNFRRSRIEGTEEPECTRTGYEAFSVKEVHHALKLERSLVQYGFSTLDHSQTAMVRRATKLDTLQLHISQTLRAHEELERRGETVDLVGGR
jgi:hypothetical protein